MVKIAFIHFGKCAGVKTNELFKQACVLKGIPVYDWAFGERTPWSHESCCNAIACPDGIGRDWSSVELNLMSGLGSGYVHNHHISWSANDIVLYNERGWETFTFLRNPRDLLCSLYFWSRKINPSPLKGNPTDSTGTLDEFLRSIVREESKSMWRLFMPEPYMMARVKHVARFSEDAMWGLVKKLGLYEESLFDTWHNHKANASGNKGWDHYIESELISEETADLVSRRLDHGEAADLMSRRLDHG